MTQSRKTQVCVEQTPFYHCIGRCVRRAYLCGFDSVSGRSFEHRRQWMQERLALLAEVYAIDLCAYALMSNHYHLIVKLCPGRLADCTDFDIADRWLRLFRGPALVKRYRAGEPLNSAERRIVTGIIREWRRRLADLSWFMRCLNEYIARRSNREDEVKGHFWEARFTSQALLDDVALLQGMVYTDLNPIRAAMATRIEDSAYTSVQQRFHALMQEAGVQVGERLPRLAPFQSESGQSNDAALPFTLSDYLDLVDTTGRCCMQGKPGFIEGHQPRILQVLGVNGAFWLRRMQIGGLSMSRALGAPERLREFAQHLSQKWMHGVSIAKPLYPS